jgi:Bifunctional DNA primase/polymerase, N-terminal
MTEGTTETAAGDLLAAALDYAGRGLCVLPLHDIAAGVCSCRRGTCPSGPGKHPRLKDWRNVASTDPKLIAGWWAHWPQANVGILTGLRSRVIVLDVDPRHGGDDSLAALVAEHGPAARRRRSC